MDGCRKLLLLLVSVGLVALSGASCPHFGSPLMIGRPLPPPALPPDPTLAQVIDVVNGGSAPIRSFSTNGATLSGSGFPSLRASVVFERPRRFRLRAETALTGAEIDLGSNDELFWIWVRRNEPPALYYCRHDQFAASPARRTLPIDPDWLVEALGIAELDPALPHQGPFRLEGGKLAVHTVRETPDGLTTKVTVIDGRRGLVLEQHLYDAGGKLLASAVTSRHRQDPLSGLTMPKVVDIYFPAADLRLRIDLGNVQINRPLAAATDVWRMPSYAGYPVVDLCDPRFFQSQPGRVSRRGRPPISGWRHSPY